MLLRRGLQASRQFTTLPAAHKLITAARAPATAFNSEWKGCLCEGAGSPWAGLCPTSTVTGSNWCFPFMMWSQAVPQERPAAAVAPYEP